MSVSAIEGVSGIFGTLPASGQTSATTTGGLPTTTSSGTSADKNMFLQLLVAQMKYQDPMSPTDSSQFLSQSAQFTSLEKLQTVADQTAQLLGAQMAFGASSLVGRSVDYTLGDGTKGSGVVHGVTFGEKGPVLDVAGVEVPIANVVTVTDASGAAGS